MRPPDAPPPQSQSTEFPPASQYEDDLDEDEEEEEAEGPQVYASDDEGEDLLDGMEQCVLFPLL